MSTQTTRDHTETTHPEGATMQDSQIVDAATLGRARIETVTERWTRRDHEARERYTARRRELTGKIRALRKQARTLERTMRKHWEAYRDGTGPYTVDTDRAPWVAAWSQIDALTHMRKFLAAPSHHAPVEFYTEAGYRTRTQLSPLDRELYVLVCAEYQDVQVRGWLEDPRGKGRTLPQYLADRDRAALRCGYGNARHVRSYAVATELLGERAGCKLANNTYLERRSPDAIAVRFHNTDIITFERAPRLFDHERVTLNTGGYFTGSTYRRMRDYLPRGYQLYRFSVPMSAIRRGADTPREYADTERSVSARDWYHHTAQDIARQELEAVTGALTSPFLRSALTMGASHKREFLGRAIERETLVLWTLTTPDGARVAFHDGISDAVPSGTL